MQRLNTVLLHLIGVEARAGATIKRTDACTFGHIGRIAANRTGQPHQQLHRAQHLW